MLLYLKNHWAATQFWVMYALSLGVMLTGNAVNAIASGDPATVIAALLVAPAAMAFLLLLPCGFLRPLFVLMPAALLLTIARNLC